MKKILLFIAAIVVVQLYFSACTKEIYTTDAADKLTFSKDTLRFDTVFTQVGSATRSFKVYNKSDKWIKINKIYLKQGSASRFHINIDGVAGDNQKDIEIAPKDSMYVFAEVTINPNQPVSASPFILDEALIFETNGNNQTVTLEAWGQNANYIPNRFSRSKLTVVNQDLVWNDPKPYVIYGILVLNACQLTIPAGARVYVHGGLVKNKDLFGGAPFNDGIIYADNGGRIVISGTAAKPVVIQSDRIEKEFEDQPGQWGAIVMGKGSVGNVVQHAIIKNCIVGLRVDSAATLDIKNTKIYNTSGNGISATHASVTAQNCLFRSNYSTSVALDFGGDYKFDYCTIANYGANADALYLGNTKCYEKDMAGNCIKALAYPMNATLRNCIVFGGRPDEISLVENKQAGFNVKMNNCVVRVKEILKTTAYPKFLTDNCTNCINGDGGSKLFIKDNIKYKNNPTKYLNIDTDYHLDTLSIAEKKGLPISGITKDLDGVNRDGATPDIGCYQYVPK